MGVDPARLLLLAAALVTLPVSLLAQFPRSSELKVDEGGTSTTLRGADASGPMLSSMTLRKPEPSTTAAQLQGVNPALPTVLPDFARLMGNAEVSSRWDELYEAKLKTLRAGSYLTPHNWFDCETILRMTHPDSGRKVLLVQADMDCVTDGSDPARRPELSDYDVARTSDWYLPETSMGWAKPSGTNPFLDYYPEALDRLKKMRAQIQAEADRDGGVVWRELLDTCDDQIYRLNARGMGSSTRTGLSTRSYLLATDDPFVVLPKGWVLSKAEFAPNIGDYAAVIHGGKIYPAVLGDAGPNDKIGEASLRLAQAINPEANGKRRAVDSLGVTYLFFPKSGRATTPPDLDLWRANVKILLDEIGGIGVELERF